jgi:DNA-binding MarR family transcriptional regulator
MSQEPDIHISTLRQGGDGVDDRVGYMLKRVQAAHRAGLDEQLRPRGLTAPQYALLAALEREPGTSNAELARRAFVTPQTMVRVLEHLEAAGLVVRHPHPGHGRILLASLTAKGARLVAGCHAGAAEVEQRMLAGLGPEQRRQLLDLRVKCAVALG